MPHFRWSKHDGISSRGRTQDIHVLELDEDHVASVYIEHELWMAIVKGRDHGVKALAYFMTLKKAKLWVEEYFETILASS
jgi:hypothetical protein